MICPIQPFVNPNRIDLRYRVHKLELARNHPSKPAPLNLFNYTILLKKLYYIIDNTVLHTLYYAQVVHMEANDLILENLIQELKRGSLVLSVLMATAQPVYGYALVASLQERGVDIEQNTLYPLLRRLENQGLLESAWQTGETRPRRYYVISQNGLAVRERLLAEWNTLNMALKGMEETL